MRQDYEKLFDKIMLRIHQEQRLLALRRRMIIFSLGLVGSLACFIPAFQMVQRTLAESGFAQFFSLIFSDSGIVLAYWQNFILTLLESLPIMSLAAFLILILVFLQSLKLLSRDIKNIFIYKNA